MEGIGQERRVIRRGKRIDINEKNRMERRRKESRKKKKKKKKKKRGKKKKGRKEKKGKLKKKLNIGVQKELKGEG